MVFFPRKTSTFSPSAHKFYDTNYIEDIKKYIYSIYIGYLAQNQAGCEPFYHGIQMVAWQTVFWYFSKLSQNHPQPFIMIMVKEGLTARSFLLFLYFSVNLSFCFWLFLSPSIFLFLYFLFFMFLFPIFFKLVIQNICAQLSISHSDQNVS